MSRRRFVSKKRPRWFTPFGPARKNKRNRGTVWVMRGWCLKEVPPWSERRMDPEERRKARNQRRNKRQAIRKATGG